MRPETMPATALPCRQLPARLQRLAVALALCAAAVPPGTAAAQDADPAPVRIGYIERATLPLPPISLVERPAADNGNAGARLGIADNNTTGAFTKQHFELVEATADDAAQAAEALQGFADQGVHFVVADLPAATLLALADAAAEAEVLVFNVSATDDVLRGAECRANVIHVAPSRSMLADALGQYLVAKKWTRWFLITGSHEADQAYAAAVKRAAQRFGAQIVEERIFEDRGGARTTDSGLAQVEAQIAVFTQGAAEHDVVVVADESEIFGPYIPYHTWTPRPVAGTDGLRPTSWSPAHDQWAAIQIQNRFTEEFSRLMTDEDMQAWTAVRMVGEAATRTNSTDPAKMQEFLLGPSFEVAAFKGQKLTLRDWDLQLRQPVLLADGRNVISVSPQDGFLHQSSVLDTLGHDRPETECRL